VLEWWGGGGNTSQTEHVLKPRYRLVSNGVLVKLMLLSYSVGDNECVPPTHRNYETTKKNSPLSLSLSLCVKLRFLSAVQLIPRRAALCQMNGKCQTDEI